MNFEQSDGCAIAWVSYNGGRADLRGTQGIGYRQGDALDFSRRFPVTRLATDLLNQECTRGACYDPELQVRGDAVLTTDYRADSFFSAQDGTVSAEDIEAFDSMLTSSRELFPGCYGFKPLIFFHKEPNEHDIMAFRMRWA